MVGKESASEKNFTHLRDSAEVGKALGRHGEPVLPLTRLTVEGGLDGGAMAPKDPGWNPDLLQTRLFYGKLTPMAVETIKAGRADPVVQFSVFTPNRLGRLHDLIQLFGAHGVHVLALMVLDTTDSAIIRVAVDDPDRTRELLSTGGFPFTESRLVVVEAASTDLVRLMAALLQAELNVNYLYSFIPHPEGKSIIALSMEDNEMAEQVLQRNQFRTLKQSDISR